MAGQARSLSLQDRMAWFAGIIKKLHPQCTAGFAAGRPPNRNEFALWVEGGQTRFFGRAIADPVFDISPVRALDAEGFEFRAACCSTSGPWPGPGSSAFR